MGVAIDTQSAVVGFRAEFPAVEALCYLNTAGGSPLSKTAQVAIRSFVDRQVAQGDVPWSSWCTRVEQVRAAFARFVSARPQEIALLTSASAAANLVARLCAQRPGHTILYRREFPSTSLPWLQLGMPITWLEPEADGSVAPEAIVSAMRDDTRYVVISHVQYQTGFRVDLDRLGAETARRGIRLIVDATQSLGAEVIDVSSCPIDALWAAGYKYLAAGYGIAPLYVRASWLEGGALPSVGWRSLADPTSMVSDRLELSAEARALELGHPPFAGIFALGGALDVLTATGMGAITAHIERLLDHLHDRARETGLDVRSPVAPPGRSAVTLFRSPNPDAATRLLARKVFVGSAGDNLRVSVHAYNSIADVDRFVAQLRALARDVE